jgi:hypothetical protein
LERLPYLYKQGRLSQVYKPYSFWTNMADAVYQSLVIFFVAYGAFYGSDVGIWEFGTVICTECLIVNNIHLAIEIRAWVRRSKDDLPKTFARSFVHNLLQFCLEPQTFSFSDPPALDVHHCLHLLLLHLCPDLQRRLRRLPRLDERSLLGHTAFHGHHALLVHLPVGSRPGRPPPDRTQDPAQHNAVGPKSGSAASHLANQGDGVGALGIGDDDSQYSRNAQMRKSSSRSTSQSSVLR